MDLLNAQQVDPSAGQPQQPAPQSLSSLSPAPALSAPGSMSTDTGYAGLNVFNQFTNTLQNDKYTQQKQALAQQAAAQYKSGDVRGAFATLGIADPQALMQQAGKEGGAQPEAYGTMSGKLQADKEFGQLPTQIAEAKAKNVAGGAFKDINLEAPDGTVIKAKMNKGTGKLYDLSGEEMSAAQLQGMKAGFAPTVAVNPNTKAHEIVSKGGKSKDVHESGAPVEVGTNGQAIILTPKQNDGLIKETDTWNKDKNNMDLLTQINSLDKAKQSIVNNAPGGQILEQMRLIRGMSPRPAVQEVMALNKGSGWQTELENMISEAQGKGMTPQLQKNMLSMVETFQNANLDEYNQALHSRVAQITNNYKVPSETVISRLAPEMPAPILQNMKNLADKGTPEDHAAVDWAHKVLLSGKRNDPNYGKALQILKVHGL